MKTKILVIEDDTAISELICMNLEAAGYDPVPIYDGEEAETAVLAEKEKREVCRNMLSPSWISCFPAKTVFS